ncbi:hypothetical protein [Croceicoccus sp. Ery5]|uniref:hypothetical protein n=1 Tax=Croceicoccus sp. Ery5 TaxID=1703340 RepID=UPI001E590A84|nr:hypothetical protein [Croceicoccus sp. Ery5]
MILANCIALLAAGGMALAPASAIEQRAVTGESFDASPVVSIGATETASIFALQQRTRQASAGNRKAPSKPKPQARSTSKPSVNHNGDRNRNTNTSNRNRSNNISGNDVNINVNNSHDDHYNHYDDHHHHDHWDDWDDDWHPVATAAAITMTAAVIGSIVASIPPDCSTVIVNGISYSQCGNTWYQPQYYGSSVQYVVVNPPR